LDIKKKLASLYDGEIEESIILIYEQEFLEDD